VAGCKPSYGLVSCNGVVPLAPSMDHPGPIARCVRDLAILLQAMVEPENPSGGLTPDYYRACLEASPTALYRPRGLFVDASEPAVRQAMDEVCEVLTRQGVLIHVMGLPAGFAEVIARHRTVMAVEGAQFHRERLAKHPDDYQPKIRQLLEEGLACPATEYAQCKTHQQQLTSDMMSACRNAILITPATTSPAPAAATTGNPAFNSPWSYTGLPTLSIPTGQLIEGLPLAIQLVLGTRYEPHGAELFRAAAWCENALGVGPLTPSFPK
jgi:Asp-tRNA(Asn)/Glu-tRNA(Gln) amidotransferase A subunit family amidase